jgi:hypothetical protein
MTSMFQPGDLVDVVIHGARFEHQGDHGIDVTVPGIDDPITVRTVDDDGEPLDAVVIGHHVPRVFPGEVWRSREHGALFFAAQDADNAPRLIAADQRAYEPQMVVDHWGPLELIASSNDVDPAPPAASPHPDAVLLSVVDVNLGDQLFSNGLWHHVVGFEDPANDGSEYRRFHTDLAITHGLLFRYADDVWVLRGRDDIPIFAAAAGSSNDVDPAWDSFLRPAGEPQPGDKNLNTPPIEDAAPAVVVVEEPEPAR